MLFEFPNKADVYEDFVEEGRVRKGADVKNGRMRSREKRQSKDAFKVTGCSIPLDCLRSHIKCIYGTS